MPSKLTKEIFIERSLKVHGNKYDYSLVSYINSYTKINIICSIHGIFTQIPNSHLLGKGCSECANNINYTTNHFIDKANHIHHNKYDYSKANYSNNHTKIDIICPVHGLFKQLPLHHLSNHGCAKCSHDSKKIKDFIPKAKLLYNKYDYSLVNYVNNYTKVDIICSIHGVFKQSPNSHLSGQQCPKCAPNANKGLEKFINQANEVHNNKYDYLLANYINGNNKIDIICSIHGVFKQTPFAHLSGQQCPKCNNSSVSKLETEWLDSLNIPKDYRNISLAINNKKYNVDGFYNEVVYEFYGDFWHGNPRKFNQEDINPMSKIAFGDLYKNTVQREQKIIKKYRVISIWEMDYKFSLKRTK